MAMAFAYHRLIVGYHGCDRAVGEEVLMQGSSLQAKENPWDWLGRGVYFWEHGPERAWEFARWKQARGEIDDPFVVGAHIHLGKCFDLTDRLATQQLMGFYEVLASALASLGREMPVNKKGGKEDLDLVRRFLDCAVLNMGLGSLEEESVHYDTVRGVFPEGKPAFPGSKIFTKTHVQVAVRNPACILGYFKPNER